MMSVLAWFLFGMFVWACVLCMSALSRKVTPEHGHGRGGRSRGSWHEDLFGSDWTGMSGTDSGRSERERELEREIDELKQRVQTLETIVTDRKFQWENELNR